VGSTTLTRGAGRPAASRPVAEGRARAQARPGVPPAPVDGFLEGRSPPARRPPWKPPGRPPTRPSCATIQQVGRWATVRGCSRQAQQQVVVLGPLEAGRSPPTRRSRSVRTQSGGYVVEPSRRRGTRRACGRPGGRPGGRSCARRVDQVGGGGAGRAPLEGGGRQLVVVVQEHRVGARRRLDTRLVAAAMPRFASRRSTRTRRRRPPGAGLAWCRSGEPSSTSSSSQVGRSGRHRADGGAQHRRVGVEHGQTTEKRVPRSGRGGQRRR